MLRFHRIAILAAALAATACTAEVNGPGPTDPVSKPDIAEPPPAGAASAGRDAQFFTVALEAPIGLTAEQRSKIAALQAALPNVEGPMGPSMVTALAAQIRAGKADVDELQRISDRNATDRAALMVVPMRSLHDALSHDQRAALVDEVEKRQQGHSAVIASYARMKAEAARAKLLQARARAGVPETTASPMADPEKIAAREEKFKQMAAARVARWHAFVADEFDPAAFPADVFDMKVLADSFEGVADRQSAETRETIAKSLEQGFARRSAAVAKDHP